MLQENMTVITGGSLRRVYTKEAFQVLVVDELFTINMKQVLSRVSYCDEDCY